MNKEEIKKVVSLVAPHLFGFEAQDEYLVHKMGYKLWFHDGWKKTEIIGQDCTYRHKIGCSFKKPPRKIAADIKRRLLKDYKADFIKTKADRIKKEEIKAKKVQMLEAIAQVCDLEISEDRNGWRQGDYGIYIRGENISIRQDREKYNFSLSLRFSEALRVATFLKSIDAL